MAGVETNKENAFSGPWEFFVDLFIEGDGRFRFYFRLFRMICNGIASSFSVFLFLAL